jgi:hypothetical protein
MTRRHDLDFDYPDPGVPAHLIPHITYSKERPR